MDLSANLETFAVLAFTASAWCLLFLAPGAAIAVISGRDRRLAAAWSPFVSAITLTALSLVYKLFGVRWDVTSVSLGILVVTVVVGTVCRKLCGCMPLALPLSLKEKPLGQGAWKARLLRSAAYIAVALVLAVSVALCASGLGGAGAPQQGNDGLFHLALIREIQRSGDASLFSAVSHVNGAHIYPVLVDAISALLTPFVSVSLAYNASLVAIGTILPTFGCVLAARAFGAKRQYLLLVPVVLCATMWTPWFSLFYNGQAPTGLSISMIAWALPLWRDCAGKPCQLRQALGPLLLTLTGLGVAHPGAAQWALVIWCVAVLGFAASCFIRWGGYITPTVRVRYSCATP